jgi:hypothetical protein
LPRSRLSLALPLLGRRVALEALRLVRVHGARLLWHDDVARLCGVALVAAAAPRQRGALQQLSALRDHALLARARLDIVEFRHVLCCISAIWLRVGAPVSGCGFMHFVKGEKKITADFFGGEVVLVYLNHITSFGVF